jgi:methyl-accepting chemotaxis protein
VHLKQCLILCCYRQMRTQHQEAAYTMIQWLIRHCFTNLELESQKNRLLLFMLVPLFAELDITINAPFTDPANLQFILYYLILFACSLMLIFFPATEKAYKYIVISGMLIFSMYELWLFQDYPVIYQIMYINLGLALIYLNGYLIMYTGIATAVLTAVGFLFWQNVFFPNIDEMMINVPIILILQVTVVLWGGGASVSQGDDFADLGLTA